MFARLSTYQGSPVPAKGDLAAKSEAIVQPVRDAPGFRGVYYLVDRASGQAASLTLWEDEAAMQASEEQAARIREEAAEREGQRILSVEHFEVAFSFEPPPM
ncbi:hypothetical protein DEJ50_17085 [Streptomyces venezuelae]|uniref:ABM domain-containing protein n=1 Tax=Streptomyces venezuelae TaxID=54571 RepID=A0A5P2D2H3_STRVZ|nr:hypothetical protein [Streptomyces venezuelae]QES49266.1 hypothetical protein DEJ50_17085 [Streptomyces venezuelae]